MLHFNASTLEAINYPVHLIMSDVNASRRHCSHPLAIFLLLSQGLSRCLSFGLHVSSLGDVGHIGSIIISLKMQCRWWRWDMEPPPPSSPF